MNFNAIYHVIFCVNEWIGWMSCSTSNWGICLSSFIHANLKASAFQLSRLFSYSCFLISNAMAQQSVALLMGNCIDISITYVRFCRESMPGADEYNWKQAEAHIYATSRINVWRCVCRTQNSNAKQILPLHTIRIYGSYRTRTHPSLYLCSSIYMIGVGNSARTHRHTAHIYICI